MTSMRKSDGQPLFDVDETAEELWTDIQQTVHIAKEHMEKMEADAEYQPALYTQSIATYIEAQKLRVVTFTELVEDVVYDE